MRFQSINAVAALGMAVFCAALNAMDGVVGIDAIEARAVIAAPLTTDICTTSPTGVYTLAMTETISTVEPTTITVTVVPAKNSTAMAAVTYPAQNTTSGITGNLLTSTGNSTSASTVNKSTIYTISTAATANATTWPHYTSTTRSTITSTETVTPTTTELVAISTTALTISTPATTDISSNVSAVFPTSTADYTVFNFTGSAVRDGGFLAGDIFGGRGNKLGLAVWVAVVVVVLG